MFMAKYRGDELEFDVWADGERCDYGVRGSPVWFEADPDTYDIRNLSIEGEDVDFDSLPLDRQAYIWTLVDNLEFERE